MKFFALHIFQKDNVDISQMSIGLDWLRLGLIKNTDQWMKGFLSSLGVKFSDTFKFMNGHATDLKQRYSSQSLLFKDGARSVKMVYEAVKRVSDFF